MLEQDCCKSRKVGGLEAKPATNEGMLRFNLITAQYQETCLGIILRATQLLPVHSVKTRCSTVVLIWNPIPTTVFPQ